MALPRSAYHEKNIRRLVYQEAKKAISTKLEADRGYKETSNVD